MSRKLLVIDAAALSWEAVKDHPMAGELGLQPMQSAFPAVTCSAQAAFRTASPASSHGMIANGLYMKSLAKVMFWEQSAALVEGERIWQAFREQGGTVGMMFWQQSLGEQLDMVLSPRPIHKHSGGMIQDCYSQPHDLYAELCTELGKSFNLMHYWGPMASYKSTDWIVDAVCAVLNRGDAPDLLMAYLPHMDYASQKFGPDSPRAREDVGRMMQYLQRLKKEAAGQGYDVVMFGDYAIHPCPQGAVYPNQRLMEAGLFQTRRIKNMLYPDFFLPRVFAMVDHELAHIYAATPEDTARAKDVLLADPGIGELLEGDQLTAAGINHPNSGQLVAVAAEGYWFAYPWWQKKQEAPDFASHIDIHNKPGFDPCEMYFGWPPLSISMDTAKVGGSHGRCGPGREVAWASSLTGYDPPAHLCELAGIVKHWLTS